MTNARAEPLILGHIPERNRLCGERPLEHLLELRRGLLGPQPVDLGPIGIYPHADHGFAIEIRDESVDIDVRMRVQLLDLPAVQIESVQCVERFPLAGAREQHLVATVDHPFRRDSQGADARRLERNPFRIRLPHHRIAPRFVVAGDEARVLRGIEQRECVSQRKLLEPLFRPGVGVEQAEVRLRVEVAVGPGMPGSNLVLANEHVAVVIGNVGDDAVDSRSETPQDVLALSVAIDGVQDTSPEGPRVSRDALAT